MNHETHEAYWKDIMENRRMPIRDETTRLTSALYGFLYKENEYDLLVGRTTSPMSPVEFWSSKRPYGNKDVDASIAYNLGWDYKRLMTSSALPDFVIEETEKLHAKVLIELIEHEEFLKKCGDGNV